MIRSNHRMKAGKNGSRNSRVSARILPEQQARMQEAEDLMNAIRDGEVDAFVIKGKDGGDRIYALRGTDRPYRFLVEAMMEGAATLDEKGHILFCNRRLAEMLKRPLEKVIGESLTAFVARPDQPAFQRLFKKGSRESARGEIRLQRSGGDPFSAHVSFSAYSVEETRAICFVATDLTDWKSLQTQLYQAQKMEGVGLLAGGIAHDFNNILNIILGHTDLLSDLENDDISQVKRIVKDAVKRGSSLVRQLLTFARKDSFDWSGSTLNDVAGELAEMIQGTFPKNISISLDLDRECPPLTVDQGQIHQVLLNLCVNARDAMPDGGKLTIKTEIAQGSEVRRRWVDATSDSYVCISVTDTGSGIEEAIRSRIFEPFFTTKSAAGTGLGLPVVYGIVKNHGGFIDVESRPGRTTFRVYLPVPRSAQQPQHGEMAQKLSQTVGEAKGTILLAEDEENMLQLWTTILKKKGYHVLSAVDGLEAVNLHRRHKEEIAVVVLDMGLPKLSGSQAYLEMKKAHPGVRAILTSGYLEPQIKMEMSLKGVRQFLQKPFSTKQILDSIAAEMSRAENTPRSEVHSVLHPST